ncbi:MAG: hypothetical protein O2931_08340 [Planctomycetota bacterium]|nr:hypothetical protein [Planctomycetota bacterium]
MSFEQQLEVGQLGESVIAKFLIRRGWQVLPAYQIEIHSGKGPRLFGTYGQLISPDLLAFTHNKVRWVEAKTKSAFTWHRISQTWQTGIDKRHWLDYRRVNIETPFETWILFLHKDGTAKDTPLGMTSPTGLFGNKISVLESNVHHESDDWGHSGMVYWTRETLRLICPIEKLDL